MPLLRLLNGDLYEVPVCTYTDAIKLLFGMLTHPPSSANCIKLFKECVPVQFNAMLEDVVYDVFIKERHLLSWVNESYLDFSVVSTLPEAIPYLSQNSHRIHWKFLCANPSGTAIEWLRGREIDWVLLCRNTHPEAIQWLTDKLIETDGKFFSHTTTTHHAHTSLSTNPMAGSILRRFPHIIQWNAVGYNTSPDVVQLITEQIESSDFDRSLLTEQFWGGICGNPSAWELIMKNEDQIIWPSLAQNPNAIPYLEEHLEKVLSDDETWSVLAKNKSPLTFPFLQKYMKQIMQYSNLESRIIQRRIMTGLSGSPHKDALAFVEENIDKLLQWGTLCSNPHALEMVEKYRFSNRNVDMINYYSLSSNPAIFS